MCSAVPFNRLARCVFDKSADLSWFKMRDHGAKACDGIPPYRIVSEVPILPLRPGTGDNKRKNCAENEGQSTDEAGDFTGGELRPYVARHGRFEV